MEFSIRRQKKKVQNKLMSNELWTREVANDATNINLEVGGVIGADARERAFLRSMRVRYSFTMNADMGVTCQEIYPDMQRRFSIIDTSISDILIEPEYVEKISVRPISDYFKEARVPSAIYAGHDDYLYVPQSHPALNLDSKDTIVKCSDFTHSSPVLIVSYNVLPYEVKKRFFGSQVVFHDEKLSKESYILKRNVVLTDPKVAQLYDNNHLCACSQAFTRGPRERKKPFGNMKAIYLDRIHDVLFRPKKLGKVANEPHFYEYMEALDDEDGILLSTYRSGYEAIKNNKLVSFHHFQTLEIQPFYCSYAQLIAYPHKLVIEMSSNPPALEYFIYKMGYDAMVINSSTVERFAPFSHGHKPSKHSVLYQTVFVWKHLRYDRNFDFQEVYQPIHYTKFDETDGAYTRFDPFHFVQDESRLLTDGAMRKVMLEKKPIFLRQFPEPFYLGYIDQTGCYEQQPDLYVKKFPYVTHNRRIWYKAQKSDGTRHIVAIYMIESRPVTLGYGLSYLKANPISGHMPTETLDNLYDVDKFAHWDIVILSRWHQPPPKSRLHAVTSYGRNKHRCFSGSYYVPKRVDVTVSPSIFGRMKESVETMSQRDKDHYKAYYSDFRRKIFIAHVSIAQHAIDYMNPYRIYEKLDFMPLTYVCEISNFYNIARSMAMHQTGMNHLEYIYRCGIDENHVFTISTYPYTPYENMPTFNKLKNLIDRAKFFYVKTSHHNRFAFLDCMRLPNPNRRDIIKLFAYAFDRDANAEIEAWVDALVTEDHLDAIDNRLMVTRMALQFAARGEPIGFQLMSEGILSPLSH